MVETWVASAAPSRWFQPRCGKKNHSAAVLTTMPARADQPEQHEPNSSADALAPGAGRSRNCLASRAARSRITCRRNVRPWRSDALESPACRGANGRRPRPPAATGLRTRISSRILKPLGLSRSRFTAGPAEREQPAQRVAHHREPARERALDHPGRARGDETRPAPPRPSAADRSPAYLVPTTRSQSWRMAVSPASAAAFGGCCRSASMTSTHRPRACRAPAMTAPPRPPLRVPGDRCSSRTGTGHVLAFSASTSGRPVVAVIDEDELGAQRRDGRTEPRQQQFDAVLLVRVGMITVSLGVRRHSRD